MLDLSNLLGEFFFGGDVFQKMFVYHPTIYMIDIEQK